MRSEELKPVQLSPLVDQVAKYLTDAILEGVFVGGDQLLEIDLQKQFHISRTPLREAFRVLEKRGLVEIIPRRGTFVRMLERKDIEELFPVRAVLEGLAAKQAFRRLNAEELKRMRECFEGMKEAEERNDTAGFDRHHLLFHEIFIRASGNELLAGILENLRMHSLWFQFSNKYHMKHMPLSISVHEEILSLFENSDTDPARLEHCVRKHIDAGLNDKLEFLEEQQETLHTGAGSRITNHE